MRSRDGRFRRYAGNWVWANARPSRSHSDFRPFKPNKAQTLFFARAGDPKDQRDFVAWQGRTGRRYVLSVHLVEPLRFDQAVIVAVRRCQYLKDAYVLDVRCVHRRRDDCDARLKAWADALGATELHLHRLADTDAERRAVAVDLKPKPGEFFFRDTEERLAALKRPARPKAAKAPDTPEEPDAARKPVRPARRLPADVRGPGGAGAGDAVRGRRRDGADRPLKPAPAKSGAFR